MSLRDLLVLYGIIGVACAIGVLRGGVRARAPGRLAFSAAMTIPLWPIWAPFALAKGRGRRPLTRESAAVQRVQRALDEAVAAVEGSVMESLFSRSIGARIATEVRTIAARLDELAVIASRTGFDAEVCAARLRELEASGAPARAIATARLQHESVLRVQELRAGDARALDELADLLEALRTQLVLARYAGSPADGVGALVSEVWARLEGLSAVRE